MKKLLLIIPAVLLLAAACNQQPTAQQNTQTPTQPVQTTPPPQNQTQTPPTNVNTQNWKTYTNTQYGFKIQLPANWEGYTTDSRKLTDGGTAIGFNFPYTFNGKKTYYSDALLIIVYSTSAWPNIYETDGTKPPKLAENSSYVYSYAIGQDLGGNKDLEMAGKDMQQIISTFQLTSAPTQSNTSLPEGWTTYKNSANSFTFNYPASWYLGSDPSNSAILRSLPNSGGSGQGLLGQNELGVEITQSTSGNTQEIKAWCENYISHSQFATQTVQFSNGNYVTVGGNNAYSVDYQIKEDARLNARQICVANGNNKFILAAYPLNSTLLSNFDKIVASFKFTK